MRKLWTILSGALVIVFLAGAGEQGPKPQTASAQTSSIPGSAALKIDRDFGKMPLYFIPNQGQLDAQVAYYLQGKDKTIYFTSEGLTYVLGERSAGEQAAEKKTSAKARLLIDPAERELRSPKDQSRWTVKLDFVGANTDVRPLGEEKTEAVISYFKGKPEEWKAGLPTYSRIVYKDLWPGIDVAYYGTMDKMKYEFIVHPGSDPSLIRLAYRGASAVQVNSEGRLEVRTPAGGFEDDRPVGYQDSDGKRKDVALRYLLEERSKKDAGHGGEEALIKSYVYGFEVGDYDQTKSLVLDPAILAYCGFIGGSDEDDGYGIAVDGSGNAYVTGIASSAEATFPINVGPDLMYNGSYDAFVAKLNASGTALIYCGYLGGSGYDFGYGIAVDGSGNAYVTGETDSTQATFPVKGGPDLAYNGGNDAFVAKVNASGTALVYCGYVGGSRDEGGYGIAIDGSGNAYITGETDSAQATFPEKVGPDLTYNGGGNDAFVAKVNASGTALVYCGYVGGSGDDEGYSIAVDGSGNAYVTGGTDSTQATFPEKGGPDLTYNGGFNDAFVAKVSTAGTALVYCGYVGGTGYDFGFGIAVDGSGNAHITGETDSTEATFPVIGGPDLTYDGVYDAFVAKVNASGTALVYCGFIGGSGDDEGWGIAVDGSGNAYITGVTDSAEATFPVIGGPDLTYNGGGYDAFVAKVNASGTALVYCGYIAGSGDDEGWGIAVDSSGNAYVAGLTASLEDTFPVIGGPDLTYNGSYDAFVAKISYSESSEPITVTSPNGGETWIIGSSHAITWTTTGTIANVKLEYSTDGGGTYAPIIASTPNTWTYAWTVPNTPSITCMVRASDAATEAVNDVSDTAFSIVVSSTIGLSRNALFFGSAGATPATGAQTVLVSNSSGGGLSWTASKNKTWIGVSPVSGTGDAVLTVTVDPSGLARGTYTGQVTITVPGATNSPQSVLVTLKVYAASGTSAPFGAFDTPISGATVRGSIPVTGWTLDDIEVTKVEIRRDPVTGDPPGAIGADGLVYVGDVTFVEGARPDVETAWPSYPLNYRAGWGYMLLTYGLPDHGNGTFVLHAVALDRDGHTKDFVTKTIVSDNAHNTKPFGAIDTPGQGATVSGSSYVNFGWVLTPPPAMVPIDGSTIWLWIDSVQVGHPTYNNYRSDIHDAYPDYLNADGAVGFYYIDTTAYANGMHTIGWSATDDHAQEEGMGSRFFWVFNGSSGAGVAGLGAPTISVLTGGQDNAAKANARNGGLVSGQASGVPASTCLGSLADLAAMAPDGLSPVYIRKGFRDAWTFEVAIPDALGARNYEIEETERIVMALDSPDGLPSEGREERGKRSLNRDSVEPTAAVRWSGYLIVGNELRPLPIGSTLDPRRGVFYWQPGPGFLGAYQFVFVDGRDGKKKFVALNIRPKSFPPRS